MPITDNVHEFTNMLAQNLGSGSIMGVDPGKKRIGIAFSDPAQKMAFSNSIVGSIDEVIVLFKERKAIAIVVGLARMLDGSIGIAADHAKKFAAEITKKLPEIPILLWDEWYSTTAVEKMLIGEADMSRGKRKKHVDKLAAAFILQGVLDAC